MELKSIINKELKALSFSKEKQLDKMHEISSILSKKLEDRTISDLELASLMQELQKSALSYTSIQGKIDAYETTLIQIGD